MDLFAGLHLAKREMVIPAPVIAEVGYLLGTRAGAEAEAFFLRSLAEGVFQVEHLTASDYAGSLTWSNSTETYPSGRRTRP